MKPSSSRIYSVAHADEPVASDNTSNTLLKLSKLSLNDVSITSVVASIIPIVMSSLHILNVDWEIWWAISPTQYAGTVKILP